jgi:hypothetical protein
VWVGFGGLRPRRGGDGAGAARLGCCQTRIARQHEDLGAFFLRPSGTACGLGRLRCFFLGSDGTRWRNLVHNAVLHRVIDSLLPREMRKNQVRGTVAGFTLDKILAEISTDGTQLQYKIFMKRW